MYKLPRLLRIGLVLLLGCTIFLSLNLHLNKKSAEAARNSNAKPTHKIVILSKQHNKGVMNPNTVNWLMPTGGTYPAIGSNDSIWIKVSKENQRVYIMNGNTIIYTMICSTGLDISPDTFTPEGTFYIQKERGLSFYNPNEKEGAKYWVSWNNNGEFLFHSVATDKNGNVIPSEAVKLGHKASHGCVRLALPDAKWIYDHIKYNTKVVIG